MNKNGLVDKENVLEYLPLIKKVVARIFPSIPPQLMDFEDLVGYGLIGLIEAIDSFNPNRGVKFSTYAFYRIRGAILDALREMDWLPRDMRKKIHQVENAAMELTAELQREPSEAEIAARLSMEEKAVATLLMESAQSEVVCFEESLHQYITQKTDNFFDLDQLEQTDVQQIIARTIEELPEREKVVLTLYYYEELNLKEIGRVLELSESRVSQILKKGIISLQKRLQQVEGEI